ncbi:hypothetical protein CI102_10330 [Trichoderma harzianum]|nr:hypothetical protein CI102_10330 [Trichoderma harzianum]
MTIARARPLSHGQTRAGWCFSGSVAYGPLLRHTPRSPLVESSSWSVDCNLYSYVLVRTRTVTCTPSCAHWTGLGVAAGGEQDTGYAVGLQAALLAIVSASVTTSCSRQIRRGRRGRLTQAIGNLAKIHWIKCVHQYQYQYQCRNEVYTIVLVSSTWNGCPSVLSARRSIHQISR